MLIAANTGFSGWIDGDGRVREKCPRRARGIVLAEVQPDPRRSLYTQMGDWPAAFCLCFCLSVAAVGGFVVLANRRREASNGQTV
jgi:apolipoprotein N-acyltransferase